MRPQGQRKEFGLFSEWDICFYFFLLSPGNNSNSTKRNSCLIPGGNGWQDLIRSSSCGLQVQGAPSRAIQRSRQRPFTPVTVCKKGDGTLEGHHSALRRAASLFPDSTPARESSRGPAFVQPLSLAWCRERHRPSCCNAVRSAAWVPAAAPAPRDPVTTAHSQAPPGPPELPCFNSSPEERLWEPLAQQMSSGRNGDGCPGQRGFLLTSIRQRGVLGTCPEPSHLGLKHPPRPLQCQPIGT